MSVPMKDEGSPSQPFVTMFFQGQALPKCRDSQIITQGEADQRVPQLGSCLWQGSLLL